MADHGLTGTHHLDGSMCTRTPSCPWSAKDYMAKAQGKTTLPGPEAFGGDVAKVFEAIMNLDPGNQQGGSLGGMQAPMPPQQSPATVLPKKPSRKAKTPPPLGPVVPMPPQPHSQPPTKEVTRTSNNNPITPADLRENWPSHPSLTEEQKAILASLPDDGLQQVLDEAFLDSEGPWRAIRKETLTRATDALVKSLPKPDSAPVGTQDECLNCGLPITYQDGPPRWSDDIMGTTTCDRMRNLTGHQPKDVMAKFKAAMSRASSTPAPGGNGQYFIMCANGETAGELLTSVRYVGPFDSAKARDTVLKTIQKSMDDLGIGSSSDGYEFWPVSGPITVPGKGLDSMIASHGFNAATTTVWGFDHH